MNSINTFFKRIKERPSIFLVLLFLITVFSALEAYNPIISKYGSFSYVLKHNYIGKLSSWVIKTGDFFSQGFTSFYYILFALLSLLLFSAFSALFFSGYMNVLLKSVESKPKLKGEFSKGIGRNFLKTMGYIYVAVIMTTVLFFMTIYSVLPVLLRVKQLTDGNAGVIFSALILGLLTALVVFFALTFYFMYFSYVLPSIAGMRKSAVGAGIKMTNTYVWYLMPKTIMFMVGEALIRTVLFIVHYGHASTAMSIVTLCFTVILRTFLYLVYLYFTFNTFVAMREDLYPEYEEEEQDEKIASNKKVNIEERKNIYDNADKTSVSNKNTYLSQEIEHVKHDDHKVSEQSMIQNININSESISSIEENSHKAINRRSRVVNRPLEDNVKPKTININDKQEDDEYDDSFEV